MSRYCVGPAMEADWGGDQSHGLPESVITTPDLSDDAENQARLRLLTEHREYGTRTGLFEGFPDDVSWQWMAITPAELATVRYIDYDYVMHQFLPSGGN